MNSNSDPNLVSAVIDNWTPEERLAMFQVYFILRQMPNFQIWDRLDGKVMEVGLLRPIEDEGKFGWLLYNVELLAEARWTLTGGK